MEHTIAVNPWASLAYLVAGVCFILALRGLSSPVSSQRGNRFGMIGMTIAVVTTLIVHAPMIDTHSCMDASKPCPMTDWTTLAEIAVAVLIGAAIGIVTARRIAMTAMPQLVAAFHSLVGMAAVLVAAAAFLNPVAFGIADMVDGAAMIHQVSRVEMGL